MRGDLTVTSAIIMVEVPDQNAEDGFRMQDIGNFYEDSDGKTYAITSKELAGKYAKYADFEVYTYNR